jgi:hypothetical protein
LTSSHARARAHQGHFVDGSLQASMVGGAGARGRKKIFIPQDQPDVNFIGLLLGPRGATLKELQSSTGAKVMIRGRGSRSDGSLDDDNQENTHIIIEGDDAAVRNAAEKARAPRPWVWPHRAPASQRSERLVLGRSLGRGHVERSCRPAWCGA